MNRHPPGLDFPEFFVCNVYLENPEYLPMRRAGYDIWLDILTPLPMSVDGAKLVPGDGKISEIFDFHFRLDCRLLSAHRAGQKPHFIR